MQLGGDMDILSSEYDNANMLRQQEKMWFLISASGITSQDFRERAAIIYISVNIRFKKNKKP